MKKTLFLIVAAVAVVALIIVSCKGRERKVAQPTDGVQVEPIVVPPNVKLYIECSSSMNGYFNEHGNAKDLRLSLYNLALKLKCDTLAFINNKIIEVNGTAQGLLRNMSLSDFRNYGSRGDVAASDLSQILNMVVAQTKAKRQLSLVVSDFIFCPSRVNALTSLGPEAEKSSITRIFRDQNLSVAIFQVFADFNGKFFTGHYEQKGRNVIETNFPIEHKRPAYVWAIGSADDVAWLMHRNDLQDLHIANSLCFAPFKEVDYNLLDRKGSYKIDRKDNHHAEKLGKDRNGNVIIDIQTDLGALPLTADYLTNVDNYATSDENYAVQSVEKMENGKYKLTVHGGIVKAGSYDIYLKMKVPDWVAKSDMTDEWDIRQAGNEQKTFGFKALVDGVMDAMKTKSAWKSGAR
mgnify:CR=1 FL=1